MWGTGRVEDTYNLIGHALTKVIRAVADQRGRDADEVGQEAGAALVCGTSLKAALDCDWDQREQREEALSLILQVLQAVETWMQTLSQEEMGLAQPSLETAQHIQAQDVQIDENGKASLIKGVAKDRRISIEDAEMRHGRKSRSVRVDGYKRHVLHDLDTGLIRAVGITPANVPEASVTREISVDLERQHVVLKELHIDRGYLSSQRVARAQRRAEDLGPRLACPRGKALFQEGVYSGLGAPHDSVPGRTGDAFCVWWHRAFSETSSGLGRCAVVHNLHVLARFQPLQVDFENAA